MKVSARPLPRGFRTAPPGLLSPAQLFDAARTLTSYANAARDRDEPILEAKFRERAEQLRARARKGMPG